MKCLMMALMDLGRIYTVRDKKKKELVELVQQKFDKKFKEVSVKTI
ncbi:hypothetical protein ACRXCV_12680 [Halobacteriovorax sp. GFR7]